MPPRPRIDPADSVATVHVQLSEHRMAVAIPLEEYVSGSTLAEADFRGLDDTVVSRVAAVQSILTRTYALANLDRHVHEGFQLCATTHCQVYRPVNQFPDSLAERVIAAAQSTAGLVMSHGGQPINAVFHADCGGGTSDASVPWGGASPPYLRGTSDAFCQRHGAAPWRFEATLAEVRDALNAAGRTPFGQHLEHIQVAEYDPAGRAVHVRLQGRIGRELLIRGEVFRAAMTGRFGARSFRSTRFTIVDSGERFVVEGHGFGHGVGLCQLGATARAREGHTPEQILVHYYPGAFLARYY